MTMRKFEAQARLQAQAAIIDLHGEITVQAESALNAIYSEAEAYETRSIVLNFSDVRYINSTGIALLVGLLARARQKQKTLLAYGLGEHYVEIFRITRLGEFMKIVPDEESALSIQ